MGKPGCRNRQSLLSEYIAPVPPFLNEDATPDVTEAAPAAANRASTSRPVERRIANSPLPWKSNAVPSYDTKCGSPYTTPRAGSPHPSASPNTPTSDTESEPVWSRNMTYTFMDSTGASYLIRPDTT